MKLIAISQRIDEVRDYGEIRDALDQNWGCLFAEIGAALMPIPNFPSMVPALLERMKPDAIVLSGGNTPVRYGGNAALRDKVDDILIRFALTSQVPLLGVCRGMQSVALYFGSTLKRVEGHIATKHPVSGSINREVNSYHGFAIDHLADEFAIAARASDGTIEAISHKKYKLYGMMWHPERVEGFQEEDLRLIRQLLCI